MEKFKNFFEQSMNENKGLTLYVHGQMIVGVVTKFDLESVEMKSREFSKMMISIDKIDGIALN